MDDFMGVLFAELESEGGLPAAAIPAMTELEMESATAAAVAPKAHEDTRVVCDDCGGAVCARSQVESVCHDCRRVYDYCDEDDKAQISSPQSRQARVKHAPALRMVGPDSTRHQRLLDRSSTTNPDEAAYSDQVNELVVYNQQHTQNFGRAYSIATLRDAATLYIGEVRPTGVIRANNKQAILAQLIARLTACEGRSKAEAAAFMRLPGSGLARGENHMRKVGACTELLNANMDTPLITAVFVNLGLVYRAHAPSHELAGEAPDTDPVMVTSDGALIAKLKAAAAAVVDVNRKYEIGIEPAPTTRATGAVYEVIRRARLAALVPDHWLPADDAARFTLDWVAARCNIRRQTVDNYLAVLADYHSRFAPVYKEHGLNARRPPAR
jgi:hypothetical protein